MLIDFHIYFWDSESYTLYWPRTQVCEVDLELLIFLLLLPGCGIANYTTGLAMFPVWVGSNWANCFLEFKKLVSIQSSDSDDLFS